MSLSASSGAPGAMPTWAAVYMALYITFSLWAHKDELTRRECGAWIALEVVGNISLLIVAAAYWNHNIRSVFVDREKLLFFVGLSAMIIFATKKIRATFADATLSQKEKVFFSLSGTGIIAVVNLPLIWWGIQLISVQ